MEELNLTPKELKLLVDNSKKVADGNHVIVFEYQDKLIKFDSTLYNLLSVNSIKFANNIFRGHYALDVNEGITPEYINFRSVGNSKQIELLVSKQKNICLTKLPTGIIRVGDFIPGVILPYHKEHKNFSEIPKDNYKLLLQLLKKVLFAVKELADNEIAHLDLVHYWRWTPHKRGYNILYKDTTPQIIDLDGNLITCGTDFQSAVPMYNQFGDLVLGYFYSNELPTAITPEMITDESKAEWLIDELENKLIKKI